MKQSEGMQQKETKSSPSAQLLQAGLSPALGIYYFAVGPKPQSIFFALAPWHLPVSRCGEAFSPPVPRTYSIDWDFLRISVRVFSIFSRIRFRLQDPTLLTQQEITARACSHPLACSIS